MSIAWNAKQREATISQPQPHKMDKCSFHKGFQNSVIPFVQVLENWTLTFLISVFCQTKHSRQTSTHQALDITQSQVIVMHARYILSCYFCMTSAIYHSCKS